MIGRGLAALGGGESEGQRAGVGLGEVVEGAGGKGKAAGGRRGPDDRLEGDGVEVAQRLLQLGDPGGDVLAVGAEAVLGQGPGQQFAAQPVLKGGREAALDVAAVPGGDGVGVLCHSLCIRLLAGCHGDGVGPAGHDPGVDVQGDLVAALVAGADGLRAVQQDGELHRGVGGRRGDAEGERDVKGLGVLALAAGGPRDGHRAGADREHLALEVGALCALVVHRGGPVLDALPARAGRLGVGEARAAGHLLPAAAVHPPLDEVGGHRAVGVGGRGQGDGDRLAGHRRADRDAAGGRGGEVVGDVHRAAGHPGGRGEAQVVVCPHLHLDGVRPGRDGQALGGAGAAAEALPGPAVEAVLPGVGDIAAVDLAGRGGDGDRHHIPAEDAGRQRHRGRVDAVGALVNVPVGTAPAVGRVGARAGRRDGPAGVVFIGDAGGAVAVEGRTRAADGKGRAALVSHRDAVTAVAVDGVLVVLQIEIGAGYVVPAVHVARGNVPQAERAGGAVVARAGHVLGRVVDVAV